MYTEVDKKVNKPVRGRFFAFYTRAVVILGLDSNIVLCSEGDDSTYPRPRHVGKVSMYVQRPFRATLRQPAIFLPDINRTHHDRLI